MPGSDILPIHSALSRPKSSMSRPPPSRNQAELIEADRVQVVAKSDLAHPAALEHVDPQRAGLGGQLILEQAAVDLIVGVRGEAVGAELVPLRDVAVVAGWEEEAQPALGQVMCLEVLLHADHLAEVLGPR